MYTGTTFQRTQVYVEMCTFVEPKVDISPKVGGFCGRIAPKL